jgi:hypothetical protein
MKQMNTQLDIFIILSFQLVWNPSDLFGILRKDAGQASMTNNEVITKG